MKLQMIIDAQNKASKDLKKAQEELDKIGDELNKLSKKAKISSGTFKKMGEEMARVGKDLTFKVSAPLLGIGALAVKTAADIETMSISFETLLGSGEAASKMMDELIKFTSKTPFQLEGVGKSARQLLSFGVEADDVQDKLKFLGDIASTANVPLSDMAAIFGKAKAKGKAMTEELLQLSDRGVPVIAVLAEQMGVTTEEIFKLASQGKVSFEILEDAMKSMSEEGGFAANGMEKKSKSLSGVFSTMRDAISLSLGQIGDDIVKTFDLKQVVKDLTENIDKLKDKWIELQPDTKKAIIILASIVTIAPPIVWAFGVIAGAIASIGAAMMFLAGNPVMLVIAGIGLLVLAWKKDFAGMRTNVVRWVEKVKGHFRAIKNFFKNLGPKLLKAVKSAFKSMLEGAGQWGINLMMEFADGIKEGIQWVKDAAMEVVQGVKDFMGFSSPTKKGPGSDADKWSPNLMAMFAKGIKDNAPKVFEETEAMMKQIKEIYGDDAEIMQVVRDWETDKVVSEKFAEISDQVSQRMSEIGDSLKLTERAFEDLDRNASESLANLVREHDDLVSGMDSKIQELTGSLGELETAYNLNIQGVDTSVGQEVIKQEELIKSLQARLAGSSGGDAAALSERIARETKVLEDFKNSAVGLEDEIAEARRRAGLTDFERFIEDTNAKREALTAEFDLKQAQIKEEISAIENQKALEIQAFDEKIAKYAEAQAAFIALQETFNNGLDAMALGAEGKIERINNAIAGLQASIQAIGMVQPESFAGISLPQSQGGGAFLTPASQPSGNQTTTNSTIGSLIGNVVINNEADENRLVEKIKAALARDMQLKTVNSI